ncbi:hypothetical protein JHK86_055532 [Glycine max]|nr:hypothetical protein JHK86_055532 [Glycine max]
MEFKQHVETELRMPVATASHEDFGIPPSSQGEEEPVAAVIPVAIPMTPTPPTMSQNNNNEKYHECLKNHTFHWHRVVHSHGAWVTGYYGSCGYTMALRENYLAFTMVCKLHGNKALRKSFVNLILN